MYCRHKDVMYDRHKDVICVVRFQTSLTCCVWALVMPSLISIGIMWIFSGSFADTCMLCAHLHACVREVNEKRERWVPERACMCMCRSVCVCACMCG